MVSWTCPYCKQSMYSAYPARAQEKVRCIGCGKWFDNSYYESSAEYRKAGETMSGNPNKVNPNMANRALQLANGKLNAAYSQYIKRHYQATGRLAPGCDSKDLQAFYQKYNGGR